MCIIYKILAKNGGVHNENSYNNLAKFLWKIPKDGK
jgi:hypothetical protein